MLPGEGSGKAADICPIGQTNSEYLGHRPPSGARRGGGGNATTSQVGQQEAAARQQAEAPVDRRGRRDEMQCNNQPGPMRDNHTREQEGHNEVHGLKAVAEGMTTIEGGRGEIEKRTAQIEKRMARRLATKVSMMGAADNRVGSGQQSREGRNNQPSMGAVKASSGWQ